MSLTDSNKVINLETIRKSLVRVRWNARQIWLNFVTRLW